MDYSHVSLISQSVWLSLPLEVRNKLATLFNLKRTGVTITNIGPEGGVVQSDGYTPQDLMPVSIARMQELLGSDSNDYYKLFHETVDNIDDLLAGNYFSNKSFEDPTAYAPTAFVEPEKIIKRRGRPRKNVQKD